MLAVVVVDDLDEAIDVVNDIEYGLSAAIYTRDINAALCAVERIDTGIVYVNAPTIGAEIPLPFGGTKHTGNGFREAGTRGIEQFSQIKTVYVDYSGRLQKAQIDTHPLEGHDDDHVHRRHDRHQWLARYERDAGRRAVAHLRRRRRRGPGQWLIDVEGRRFLDLTMGIAVTNVGHCHPASWPPPKAQLARADAHVGDRAPPAATSSWPSGSARCARSSSEPQVFFCNSGAEAVDGALKLARRRSPAGPAWSPSAARSTAAPSAPSSLTTAKAKYREGYEPLLGGVTVAPYAYRCARRRRPVATRRPRRARRDPRAPVAARHGRRR